MYWTHTGYYWIGIGWLLEIWSYAGGSYRGLVGRQRQKFSDFSSFLVVRTVAVIEFSVGNLVSI